jgi:hypothetical protein
LEELLLQAAGLTNKREIPVAIISPKIDPTVTLTADEQLSGEFLFHFGGFFDQKFRESDFSLGYRNARTWLETWPPGRVTDPATALAAVNNAYQGLPWGELSEGDASLATLSLREKLAGAGLVAHIGRVVTHDLGQDVVSDVEDTHARLSTLAHKLFSRRSRPPSPSKSQN